MATYFIKDETLTNIGNAIREKTGSTALIFPENMPAQIRNIQTTNVDTENIDSQVVAEAERVANSIFNKMTSNSITFIAMSDMHEMGDSDSNQDIVNSYRLSNQHAAQGAKIIAQKIGLDFFANLGDFAWGASTTTPYDLFSSVETAKNYLDDIKNLTECIMVPGNHDSAFNWTTSSGEFIADDYVAAAIGNYRYIDFDSKKVRVIALNSAERLVATASASVGNISDAQLSWFANTLDLSGKSTPSDWKIIILSHHPFGSKYLANAAKILEAYVNGNSITINSTTYNFSGKNAAKVIAQFHGHTHCFKVANIIGNEEIDVKRIAIPNACQGRNNEYGKGGDLEYGEEAADTCPNGSSRKSTTAGDDTAFCVITIDLDNEIIYADCFGSHGDTAPGSHAGYDRVISYADEVIVTYSITNNLANVTNNNNITTVVEGSNYSASIIAISGYEVSDITVTMGGTDITASAVRGNNVIITNVTGDIVITATAVIDETPETGDYTNLVPTSLDPNNTSSVFNINGYKDGYYISGNNTAGEAPGYTSTGGIYLPEGVTDIYIRGCEWDTASYARMQIGSENTPDYYLSYTMRGDYSDDSVHDIRHWFTLTSLGNKYFKLTYKADSGLTLKRYYRMTLKGSGADLIITHDQPIPEDAIATYSVTKNLTNVTSNNPNTAAGIGASYTATLTANNGYTLDNVTITMGGTNVTSSVYSNGTITITSVTGDIVITATASQSTVVTDNNLVRGAQSIDSTALYGLDYNGDGKADGYKDGYRLSSSSPYEGEKAGYVCTGWIPYTYSPDNVIYIRGATLDTSDSYCRIHGWVEKTQVSPNNGGYAEGSNISKHYTVEQPEGSGVNYYKLTPKYTTPSITYMRLSLKGTGANLTVTVNEPIV